MAGKLHAVHCKIKDLEAQATYEVFAREDPTDPEGVSSSTGVDLENLVPSASLIEDTLRNLA